jgi:hypothetical protein
MIKNKLHILKKVGIQYVNILKNYDIIVIANGCMSKYLYDNSLICKYSLKVYIGIFNNCCVIAGDLRIFSKNKEIIWLE